MTGAITFEMASYLAGGFLTILTLLGTITWKLFQLRESLRAEIALLKDDLSAHRLEVARDYATNAMVSSGLKGITAQLDRLAERIDRVLETR